MWRSPHRCSSHGEMRSAALTGHGLPGRPDGTTLAKCSLGFGGDFYYKGVHARLMTQFGMYSQTTPRNDASSARGQWQLDNAYRYLAEAYGGYHINLMAGINIQAGIFMSYVAMATFRSSSCNEVGAE